MSPQETTLEASTGMSASVLKEESELHTTEYTTVHPLCHLDLLLHIISLHLGKTPPGFLVSFAGEIYERILVE